MFEDIIKFLQSEQGKRTLNFVYGICLIIIVIGTAYFLNNYQTEKDAFKQNLTASITQMNPRVSECEMTISTSPFLFFCKFNGVNSTETVAKIECVEKDKNIYCNFLQFYEKIGERG